MRRRLLTATVLLAVAALPAQPSAAAPADAPAIVLSGVQPTAGAVEIVVSARRLPSATTLAAAEVTVTADGVALPSTTRPVTRTGTAPARAVVLVLDTSGSMTGDRITAARSAALDYATAAPAEVRLGLVTVADRAAVALAPTDDRAAFAAAVSGLAAGGRTALYDGIRAAQDELDDRRNPAAAEFLERRVIVLSDGADTSSRLGYERLLSGLAGADATIDAVAFGEADRQRLDAITATTGGTLVTAGDAAALRPTLRGMADHLSVPLVVQAEVPPALAGRSALLRVHTKLGATTLSAEAPVTFAADPSAVRRQPPFRFSGAGPLGRGPMLAVLAAALFGAALLAVRPLLARDRLQRRIRQLDRFAPARAGDPAAPAADGNAIVQAALAVSERAVRTPDRRRRLEAALDRAGSPLRVGEWQLIRLGCALGGALVLLLVLPWWCAMPVGAAAGWWAAGQYLRLRAARRSRSFEAQLPDALQLVLGSLRSGFSLPQALDALIREGAEPVAGEFGRALAETRLGGDLESALERLGERNGSQDMAWLVMAIRIQREVGGNLSEVLETAVGTIRERGRLHRHVRALSAEGRLSALILLAMPIVLGAWMFVFRRDYLRPLYTEPLGLLMLGASVIGVLLGGLWLRKLVRVEV